MLQPRLLPPGIRHQARPVGDPELIGDETDRDRRNLTDIDQERAQETHYTKLNREPQPIRIPTTSTNELLVGVVQEEEPLELRQRRRATETAVGGCLLIREEIHRHRAAP